MDDRERRQRKADMICARMREVANSPALMGMLDERALDLLMIALGLGEVAPSHAGGDWVDRESSR